LLQFALENPYGFLDIVVDDMDLHLQSPRFLGKLFLPEEEEWDYSGLLGRVQARMCKLLRVVIGLVRLQRVRP
jgi:hypothetical protein